MVETRGSIPREPNFAFAYCFYFLCSTKRAMLSYWIWLAVYVFIPSIIVLIWKKDLIKKYKRTVVLCGIGSLIFAVPWDYFAVGNGIWWFPPAEIIGVNVLGLPIEEWLFTFFIGMEIAMFAIVYAREKNV